MTARNILMTAAGNAGGDVLGIEDVFSTYLYTGNNSTQTITNGIDLAGEGGLVWIKNRNFSYSHVLTDTLRGTNSQLNSNTIAAAGTATDQLTGFNTNGFSVGAGARVNESSKTYASWTFRKQPKFFDVVTYTGNSTNRTIAHDLGSVPGCIIVKRIDSDQFWQVYHRSLANTEYLVLNTTDAKATGATRWNSTTPTSTVFSLGTDATVNVSGGTYVAYLFAHDAGGFGESGTDNVISCGSFVSGSPGSVTLGYEPQWLLIKRADDSTYGGWYLVDAMRGLTGSGSGNSAFLYAHAADAEYAASINVHATATGFTESLFTGGTYIYIAIRRGPMKVPESGTSVFAPLAYTGTGSARSITSIGWPTDFLLSTSRNGYAGIGWGLWDRLRGTNGTSNRVLVLPSTGAEQTGGQADISSFDQLGVSYGSSAGWGFANASGVPYSEYFFRRAPGFFDEVCYTGTGVATTVAHNLTVAPELMIVKSRSAAVIWTVYSATLGNTSALRLNTADSTAIGTAVWNSTTPTIAVFSVDGINNTSAQNFAAYLFASCPGVSKVGSYTGNGSSQTINCGFTGGARFVMIKRTDSAGDWYVWDTARGIVANSDPHLSLNTAAAEVTTDDSVDPTTSGFIVNQVAATNINVTSATYIFLAIA